MADSYTGNGTTIAFTPDEGSSAAVGRIISLDGYEEELPDVEDDDLETVDFKAFIPGDLKEHTPVTGTAVFNVSDFQTLGGKGMIVITFPLRDGASTAAKHQGLGWFNKRGYGSVANNERITAPFSFRFYGGNQAVATDRPTFTPEV